MSRCTVTPMILAAFFFCVAVPLAAAVGGQDQSVEAELRRALLAGDHEEVLAFQPEDGHSFEVLELKARAQGEQFWRKRDDILDGWTGRPDAQQAVALREAAQPVTAAYERAITEAPDGLATLAVGQEWWGLNNHWHFDADSQVIREAMEEALPARGAASAAEVAAIHGRIEAMLSASPAFDDWSPDARDQLAQMFATELAWVLRIDGADRVADQMLDDLPVYLDKFASTWEADSLDTHHDTLRWVVWWALIRQPTAEEQQVIEEQVTKLADLLEEATAAAHLDHDALTTLAEASRERFLAQYEQLRQNRYAPYFNRAMRGAEYKRLFEEIEKYLEKQQQMLAGDLESLADRPNRFPSEDMERRYRERKYASHARIVYSTASGLYAIRSTLRTRRHLPDGQIRAASGNINGDDALFQPYIGKVDALKPFPAPKYLTRDEAAAASRER